MKKGTATMATAPLYQRDYARADYSAAVAFAGRGSRRSAIRADLPVRPRR